MKSVRAATVVEFFTDVLKRNDGCFLK